MRILDSCNLELLALSLITTLGKIPLVSGAISSDAFVLKTPISLKERSLPRDIAIVKGCRMSSELFLGLEIKYLSKPPFTVPKNCFVFASGMVVLLILGYQLSIK